MSIDIYYLSNREEKKSAITKCGDVYPFPLIHEDKFGFIFDKIDKNAIFLAAYDNDNIVGYAAMYANDFENKIAYLSLIAVKTDHQGKNIGSRLLSECEKKAQNNGMNELRLEVYNSNINAINFYKNRGYIEESHCSSDSMYLSKKI